MEEGPGNLKLIGCIHNKKNEKNLINIFNKSVVARERLRDMIKV